MTWSPRGVHRRRCLRRVGVAVQLPSSGFRGSGGEVSARDGVGWGWMGVVVKLRIFSGMMAMAWLRWFAIGCDWKVDAPEWHGCYAIDCDKCKCSIWVSLLARLSQWSQQYWQPSLALIPLDLPWFASMQLVLFIGLALTVQVLREASKVEKKSQTSVDTLGWTGEVGVAWYGLIFFHSAGDSTESWTFEPSFVGKVLCHLTAGCWGHLSGCGISFGTGPAMGVSNCSHGANPIVRDVWTR